MAITRNTLQASFATPNAAVYTTGAFTLVAGRLYTIAILGHRTSGGQGPTSVVHDSGGTPLAFVSEVTNIAYASDTLKDLTLWRVIPSSDTANAAITITYSATHSVCCWILEEWDGIDSTGTGIVQSVINNGTGVTPTATLAAYSDSNNAGYFTASIGVIGRTFTAESGWTGEVECNDTEREDLSAEAQLPGSDTTPSETVSGASVNWGAIAAEIQAAATVSFGGEEEHLPPAPQFLQDNLVTLYG